jgi:hypothetical protein
MVQFQRRQSAGLAANLQDGIRGILQIADTNAANNNRPQIADPSHWQPCAGKALTRVEQGGNLLSNGLVVEAFRGNELIVYFGSDLTIGCSLTASPFRSLPSISVP